jgi:hypothetical protein
LDTVFARSDFVEIKVRKCRYENIFYVNGFEFVDKEDFISYEAIEYNV